MAELKNEDEEEHALPAKRKPDLLQGKENESITKKQKCGDEDDEEDEEEEDYEGDDDDDDGDDESEDGEDEHSNGEDEIDRKGKGVMKEDKGKGKLIEESDDSSDGVSDSDGDGDSDLSDDPLAEVDLDNILPSRTRRRAARPGVFISNHHAAKDNDDSDA